ncbi:D-glycero-beta-D-manno-heptose 1-phosphate adenylyltransferase [Microbacterium ureisolvens]|uniref:Bifunctional protein HldE n=1 Tax=Microbacterium ureisolvens TaxID=2781186 RepID=A0ABS7I1W3_9MICO|nr:D-glycero-beta-D-manno-heptose 1-phosphate adenylyltransferase [Microbacterium ureisolvens]MBW9111651.1 D-glycero-beta-D-manno-heptose 1-phosphate adenylyltransferase [Microbacterium ureisolvens]
MDTTAAADLIRRTHPRVVVVGDAILDRWWRGTSHRLSREAPAPVVELRDAVEAPGGAGNTAANLAALGAHCELVAVIGGDETGATLVTALETWGVGVGGVSRDPRRRTISKTRVVADDQVLARVDDCRDAADGRAALDPGMRHGMIRALRAALQGASALVVSDYGSRDLPGLVGEALDGVERPALVVDAHDLARWRDLRPDVAVPNADEAERLLGLSLGEGHDRRSAAVRRTHQLLTRSGARHVIVTLDRDGAVLLRAEAGPVVTMAHPVAERFASGAGDTFTAGIAASLAAGIPLETGVRLAQGAADVAVSHEGTSVCDGEELAHRLAHRPAAVLDAAELAERVARHRADGRRIVFTNGCFDVLHVGHTAYLKQARELGDVLIVAINSDASVRRLKGPDRPLNGADDRAGLLAALEWVDHVTVFEEDTPIALLERLQPDVYVKGGDYSPDMLREAPVVEAYGGEVRVVDYVPDHSTTSLVERIRSAGRTAEPAP